MLDAGARTRKSTEKVRGTQKQENIRLTGALHKGKHKNLDDVVERIRLGWADIK